ncbi:IS3 family transposase [Salinicoccus sediminis]|uniref:IS3 family transposase n=1 Tax=Salinicoccus sediminis TaxID=1432562 RepID=UPI000ADEF4CD
MNHVTKSFFEIFNFDFFQCFKRYQTFDALKRDIDRFITFFNKERITLKMAQLI